MAKRTLRLVKESLTPLDTGELRAVVGGNSMLPCLIAPCDYTYCPECVNDLSFEFCPTLPVEQCV